MHLVTRIEIIVSSQEVEKVLNTLEKEGVPGYSLMRSVKDKSDCLESQV